MSIQTKIKPSVFLLFGFVAVTQVLTSFSIAESLPESTVKPALLAVPESQLTPAEAMEQLNQLMLNT